MKLYKALLQFGIWLAACMPLASYAVVELPYWLSPDWIAAKVSSLQVRNAERLEHTQTQTQTQKQEFSKNSENINPANANAATIQPAPEQSTRKSKLAPVEFATPKVNEKYLSKEELHELRMQLKQKP